MDEYGIIYWSNGIHSSAIFPKRIYGMIIRHIVIVYNNQPNITGIVWIKKNDWYGIILIQTSVNIASWEIMGKSQTIPVEESSKMEKCPASHVTN